MRNRSLAHACAKVLTLPPLTLLVKAMRGLRTLKGDLGLNWRRLTTGVGICLLRRALPTEMARGQLAGQAMCMEQYYRLLRSYRLPGKGCDRLMTIRQDPDEVDSHDSHVVVVYRDQVS